MSNRRYDGDGTEANPASLNVTTQRNARSNRQIINETVIGITAKSGGTIPKGKDSKDCDDTLGEKTKKNLVEQTQFEAREDVGSCRRQMDLQIGDAGIRAPKGSKTSDPISVDSN